LAIGLGAAACSTNKGTTDDSGKKKFDAKLVYVDDAKGPAPEIKDAKRGGTVTVLNNADLDHWFPQANYRGDGLMIETQLTNRTLTGYYEADGKIQVKGDLATTTGKSEDNCKKWTYTLRDNIKFEDGTAITSKHIADGISLAFDEGAADGPTYVQQFLAGPDWNEVYKGPLKAKGTVAPGISTPDPKTIVFTFKDAHCDFPLAAALLTTSPTILEKYNPANPESLEMPIASGPYKVAKMTRGEKVELERNPQWDPKSDPLRHDYPDKFVFDFTQADPDLIQKRLVADQGPDKFAVTLADPGATGLADIDASAAAKSRVIEGETVYTLYTAINTKRVTDVDVRRALWYGMNHQAILQVLGGDRAGKIATSLTSPTNPAWKKFDVYPKPASGDVDKAKSLLQGKTLKPLKLCFRAGGLRPKVAAAQKEALARIGVEVVLTELDRTVFYNIVGKNTTDCDLINGGWGQDYPDGITFPGVMYNPKESKAAGSNNLAFFDDATVQKKLDEIAAMSDRSAANKAYGDLEEQIFKDSIPYIPLYWDYTYSANGSGLGGLFLGAAWGYTSLQDVYVKS
jgi:peptide/nickel transport system substrate-binding protein